MTQEDIVSRIIKQDGCHGISCSGKCLGCYNEGVECPFIKEVCMSYKDSILKAKAWADKHGLSIPYSSTFTVEHRFKPGDRVQHKDTGWARPTVITVAELIFGIDCGVFYRFAEAGVPTCSIRYCDENMRLADREEEVGQAKEMP